MRLKLVICSSKYTAYQRHHLINDLKEQTLKKKFTTDQQMLNIAQKDLVLPEQMINRINESDIQQVKAIKITF